MLTCQFFQTDQANFTFSTPITHAKHTAAYSIAAHPLCWLFLMTHVSPCINILLLFLVSSNPLYFRLQVSLKQPEVTCVLSKIEIN